MRTAEDLSYHYGKKPLLLFGRQMRKLALTEDEIEVLKELKQLGHQPIVPAIAQLEPSYEGHSAKDCTPVEALHVVRAGILKDWIFIVIVILQVLKTAYPGRFADSLTILDQKLINFTTTQSLPFHLRKFSEGKH
jgi:hypothetical protein